MKTILKLFVALIFCGSTCSVAALARGPATPPNPRPASAAKLPPRPAARPQLKPAPKPQPRPAPKPQPRPAPKPRPKPAPRPAPKPQPKPAPKPAPRPQPKPQPQPQPKPGPTAPSPPIQGGAPSALDQRLLDLTNQVRAGSGLNPLSWNNRLAAAATGHTLNMLAQSDGNGFPNLDHVLDGRTPQDRARTAGYGGGVGENIYFMWLTDDDGVAIYPEGAIQAWLNSPGHRANLLDPRWREMGAGIVIGGNPVLGGRMGTYTQLFGDGSSR